MLGRCVLHRIQVLSDREETKVCDPCAASRVDENVCLARCQYDDETKSRAIAYSLEIPMDHVAVVEEVEPSGNIGQLVVG